MINNYNDLRAKIKQLRESKKWSPADVGARLGRSDQAIRNWESGKNELPASMLWDIAGLYGLSIQDLFSSDAPPPEPKLSPGEERILQEMAAMKRELREACGKEATPQPKEALPYSGNTHT